MAEPDSIIFSTSIFTKLILPFLLVFTLVFAILDKSKILGEGKRQINAIIALVVGLLLVGVPGPRNVIVTMIPWLAVAAVVILVFLVLWGFIASGKEGLAVNKGLKIAGGILIGIFVVIATLVATGSWDKVYGTLSGVTGPQIWTNVLLIAIIAAAIATVLSTTKKASS